MSEWGNGPYSGGLGSSTRPIAISGGVSYVMPTPADAESPVSRELGVMVSGIVELEQAIGVLARRLDPVSLRQPQATSAADGANQAQASNVVGALSASNSRIADCIRFVQRITAELQV